MSAISSSIEFFAAREQRRIILRGGLQQFRRFHAVAPPVGTQLLAEILDGVNFVVGHDDLPLHGFGADVAQVEDECQHRLLSSFTARGICASSCAGKLPFWTKPSSNVWFAPMAALACLRRSGGIDVAPVDAMIIADEPRMGCACVPTRNAVNSPAFARDHSTSSLFLLTASWELVLS